MQLLSTIFHLLSITSVLAGPIDVKRSEDRHSQSKPAGSRLNATETRRHLEAGAEILGEYRTGANLLSGMLISPSQVSTSRPTLTSPTGSARRATISASRSSIFPAVTTAPRGTTRPSCWVTPNDRSCAFDVLFIPQIPVGRQDCRGGERHLCLHEFLGFLCLALSSSSLPLRFRACRSNAPQLLQTRSLFQMLNDGLRAFDLRIGYDTTNGVQNNDTSILRFYHSEQRSLPLPLVQLT